MLIACKRVVAGAVIVLAGAAGAAGSALASTHHSYRSPGYRWNHRLPRVAPVVPGRLLSLGEGENPHVLVDAAGTGQIAYSTSPTGAASVVHDCVLMRGQTGCVANGGLVPPESGGPAYNTDYAGPTPLSIGNELLMVDHRYPNVEKLPDGSTGYPTFMWTSEDGGRSFTGPGTIGNLDVNGNAIVFGGAQPQIGVITDTTTGGTFFQATPPGAFSRQQLNLGDQGPDEAYNGRLALDGDRPVAEFQDLSNHIFIREYNGVGDIHSAASWPVTEMPGQGYSRLVGGPSGVWLLYQKTYAGPLFVQRIVNGAPSGAAAQVTPDSNFWHANYAITEDAGGRLTVGWFTSTESSLYVATSTDGVHWSNPQVIAENLTSPSHLALGAAGDGGGFAAFQAPLSGSATGYQIEVAAFGTFAATHQKGLGNVDGTGAGGLGGDPLASVSCTDVHFGDIDALAEAGCFLRDPRNPNGGAAMSQGQIRLNGLEIIPDAGVQILIDPRQHTINTTGSVQVVLRAPGVGDITLYHGELHVSLPGGLARAGQTLFDFDTSTASGLKGFPFSGSIAVQIGHDGVVIPVALTLPPYMGGITGQATLLADNAGGLQLSSLHIAVPDLVLGALEVKNLSIAYAQAGNRWDGTAQINIPAATPYFGIGVAVRFDNGDFTMGSFNVRLPFPGAPIFTDTYFDGFGGGFDLHPASRRFFGSINVGAIPLDPPNYTVDVTGSVAITFPSSGPVVLEANGFGAVHGFQLATAKLIFQSNGYFEVDGNLGVNLGVADLQAGITALVDLPRRSFSASAHGYLRVLGQSVTDAQAVVSSVGVAACGSLLGGDLRLHYRWGDIPEADFGLGCDVSKYEVAPAAAGAAARRGRGAVAVIAARAGEPFEDIAVTGAGAPPTVILHGPGGRTLTPVPLGPGAASAPVVAAVAPGTNTVYVMLRRPGRGRWTVGAAPGSSPITTVRVAHGYRPVSVRASVGGRGRTRQLRYAVNGHAGATVTFAERGRRTYHVLGSARSGRGTMRFSPADGSPERRTIYAIISTDGIPSRSVAVASYLAPGPVTPSAVRGLRVSRHGRSFQVRFGNAAAAAYYLVTMTARDGRRLQWVIRRGPHARSLPMIGYADHLTAKVVAVSAFGRRGRAVTARA